MLDGLSFDQIRIFVVVVESGSFSAAGRRLNRAQSAISEAIRALEAQLNVGLFDRSGRYPKLTPAGSVLLANAYEILTSVEAIKARSKGISAGLEAELSISIDVFFPIQLLSSALKDFAREFPTVPLRVQVEALGAAYQPIIGGSVGFGIVGSLPEMPGGLTSNPLCSLGYAFVVAAGHPLSEHKGTILKAELSNYVQLVLADRSDFTQGINFGVLSHNTWRVADLFAKHSFLLAGLGWGGIPVHMVETDIQTGRLVEIKPEGRPTAGYHISMSVAHRIDNPPGPAGRWLVERLKKTACIDVNA